MSRITTRDLAASRARRVCVRRRQPLDEQLAVGQSGQRVVVGEVMEFLLPLHVIRARTRRRRRAPRASSFPRRRRTPVAAAYSTNTPTASPSTSSGRPTIERKPRANASSGRAIRRRRDVVADDRLSCCARRARPCRCLRAVLPRDRRSHLRCLAHDRRQRPVGFLHRCAVDHPDPGQLEPPVLHGDAAGFVEQFLSIANAHDRRVDAAQHRGDAAQARRSFRCCMRRSVTSRETTTTLAPCPHSSRITLPCDSM